MVLYVRNLTRVSVREIKVLAGLCYSLETLRENPFPCCAQVLEASSVPNSLFHIDSWSFSSISKASNVAFL